MDRRRRAARTVALMSLFTMAETQTDVPIASFVGDGSNLVSLSVAIEPIQDLHGYDNPWPAGSGANIMDDAYSASYTNEIVLTEGTYYAQAWLTQSPSQHTTNPSLLLDGAWTKITPPYSGDGISIAGTSFGWLYNNATQTITVDAGKTFTIRYNRNNEAMQTRRLTFSKTQLSAFAPYSNICPISGWTGANIHVSPTTDAADGTTYSITFPPEAGTVYGGTLDVTTGKLTATMAMVDLGSLSWLRDTSGAFYALFTNKKAGSLYTLCSELKSLETSFGFSKYPTYPDNIIGGNESLASNYFYCKATAYNDAGSFKAAMSGVMCVYELATPIVYDLTPTQVTTLIGTNNIWADTGDIKYIEYNI